jgi:hypothetical protein
MRWNSFDTPHSAQFGQSAETSLENQLYTSTVLLPAVLLFFGVLHTLRTSLLLFLDIFTVPYKELLVPEIFYC